MLTKKQRKEISDNFIRQVFIQCGIDLSQYIKQKEPLDVLDIMKISDDSKIGMDMLLQMFEIERYIYQKNDILKLRNY